MPEEEIILPYTEFNTAHVTLPLNPHYLELFSKIQHEKKKNHLKKGKLQTWRQREHFPLPLDRLCQGAFCFPVRQRWSSVKLRVSVRANPLKQSLGQPGANTVLDQNPALRNTGDAGDIVHLLQRCMMTVPGMCARAGVQHTRAGWPQMYLHICIIRNIRFKFKTSLLQLFALPLITLPNIAR